jgi:membrane-associated phospholipid phosphatase
MAGIPDWGGASVPCRLVAERTDALAQSPDTTGMESRAWLVAVSLVVLAVTTVLAFITPPLATEVSIMTWMNEAFGGSLLELSRFLDVVGGVDVMSPLFVALAAVLFLVGRRRPARAVLAATAATLLLNIGIKTLVDRPRPVRFALSAVEVDPLASYPSGHTLFATVFFGLLVGLVRGSRWRSFVLAMGVVVSVLMAVSRVYLGEHFPSDVVASFAIGILIVDAVDRFIGLSTNRSNSARPEADGAAGR